MAGTVHRGAATGPAERNAPSFRASGWFAKRALMLDGRRIIVSLEAGGLRLKGEEFGDVWLPFEAIARLRLSLGELATLLGESGAPMLRIWRRGVPGHLRLTPSGNTTDCAQFLRALVADPSAAGIRFEQGSLGVSDLAGVALFAGVPGLGLIAAGISGLISRGLNAILISIGLWALGAAFLLLGYAFLRWARPRIIRTPDDLKKALQRSMLGPQT